MELHIKSKKYNDADVLKVEEDLALKSEAGLKAGFYIYNKEDNLISVESVPEDFSAYVYLIENGDMLTLFEYEEGIAIQKITINPSEVAIYSGSEKVARLASNGVSRIDMTSTYILCSLNAFDSTLRNIIETAISSNTAVSCSSAQWAAISIKLKNCLYFYLNNYQMIKCLSNNNTDFCFGNTNYETTGAKLEFSYDVSAQKLQVKFTEI